MSARRWFTVTLGHLKSSPLALGKSSVTPKTGLHITFLQHQISCHIVWKPTHLRAFGTSSQIVSQVFGRVKKIPSGFVNALIKGRTYGLAYQDSKPPQKMRKFMNDAVELLLLTPASAIVTMLTGTCALSFHNFYKRNLVKLPLNDRMAFILQTDEEALDNSEIQAKLLMNESINGPNRKPWLLDGENIDPSMIRLEKIMKRLLDANPELTHHLMPGGEWRIRMKLNNMDLNWGVGRSFGCGVIVFAADIVPKLDDDELALILAHEMTHAVQRHENECWSINSFFFHYFYNIMMPIKVELETGKDVRSYLRDFSQALRSMGFAFMDHHTWEREADDFAFKFASKACYDYRKFAQCFLKVAKLNQSSKAGIPPPDRKMWDPNDPSYSEKDWIMYSMQTSDFKARNIHDSSTARANHFDTKSKHEEAEAYRREGKCPPLTADPVKAVKELSQKVDEITAAWRVRIQSQGEPTLQSQGEQTLQSQGEQTLQSQGEQTLQCKGESTLLSHGEQKVQSQGEPTPAAG